MKLKSFYKDEIYIISQTNHGINQAFTAFDFGYLGYGDKNLYAPADLVFKRSWGKDYDGGTEYWITKDSYVQIVHWTPSSNSGFKQKDKMGLVKGDHVHITLNVQNKWQVYLDYAIRTAELYFWKYGQKHDKWTNWGTYTDRYLISYEDSMQKIEQLPYLVKCTSTNTTTFNIRSEAKVVSLDLGDVPVGHVWYTNAIAYGEVVSGNNKWYQIRVPTGEYKDYVGYCSATWVREEKVESDCTKCETELALANVKINNLQNELISYQPVTFYTKK